jgi:adenylate cyclase
MKGGSLPELRAAAVIVALVAMLAFGINYLGRNNYLPEGSEHWTEDWLIHYFSPSVKRPRQDIALVLVDAESLEKASLPAMPPPDRDWMAKLITAISKAEPLAIGVDFYYVTPVDPAKDEALATAIRDAKVPVVLATVDDRLLPAGPQRPFHRDFIRRAGGLAGHIKLQRSQEVLSLGDKAVRLVDHGPSESGYTSLTSTLAGLPQVVAALGKHPIPEGAQRIDWLLAPEDTSPFWRYPAYEFLAPEPGSAPPDLKGKIVFIGPDFAGLDQHTVPFLLGKQQGEVFPGVFIHAQALAQILDGRFFYSWSTLNQFLLLFAIGLAGAAVGWVSNNSRLELIAGIAGTLAIIALSIPFFIARIPLPTALAILVLALSLSTAQRIRDWLQPG